MHDLAGKVVLVMGAGEGIGRAVALALGAAGARVLAAGREERALGETVGEIAHGGGKARMLASGEPEAAVARTLELFGAIDAVVAADPALESGQTFAVALRAVPRLGLLDALHPDFRPEEVVTLLARALDAC
jgi:NAD(P)-dependent dehydrogenase (short-subunit alcohol dehydrogenase family)